MMTAIDFNPEKKSVEELLVGPDYYVIPRFQRPYSWEPANLEEFWADVATENQVGYFIGPMVAWKDAKSPIRRIVDGQQRLTTICIILAAVRNKFAGLGETRLAGGIQRYLEKPDRNYDLQFTLQTEVDSHFLSKAIFKFPPDRSFEPNGVEETSLASALRQIENLLEVELEGHQDPRKRLTDLRDRLLGLKVIWVEHGREDDAYIIFETLNSRGKDLQVADLLKNHLLNKLRGTRNTRADASRLQWDRLRDQLAGTGDQSNLDANRYILHWWQSRADYVAQRRLFAAIKATVKTKAEAALILKELAADGLYYRSVMEPDSRSWPVEEVGAGKALGALALFGVTQPAPLLLSLMRARSSSSKLNAAQFRGALQVVERFHFQHTVVSQLSSSGGVSQMYAKAARELYLAGDDQQKRADALSGIKQKLVDRRPERQQFILAFKDRFVFTNGETRDKKLVRYVLSRFLEHFHPTTSQENLSIEHLMPQDRIGDVPASVVGSIGNLMLVSEKVNGALKNRDFVAKKPILSAAGASYSFAGLLEASDWTISEIEARSILLAEIAYDSIWKLK